MEKSEPANSELEALRSELQEEKREFAVPGSKQSKLAVATRALRHRNFQLFFSGQLISLVGTWMDTVAESWLVYRLTGSALLLGTVAFCNQIPVFLFAPIGGIVADRYNRHRIIIATQALSMVVAFILAVLTLTHRVQVWQIMALAAAGGVINAFDIPARQAFLIEMVGREDLLNAIALNSSMFNGARIIGPAVAGIVVAAVGEGWCFMSNSLSYIAVITGLLLMKLPARQERLRETSPLEEIIDGFKFVKNATPIRTILLMLGLVSLVGMPYAVLMPIFAAQILHGGARALGILMGATGVGASARSREPGGACRRERPGQADRILRRRIRPGADCVFLLARVLAVGAAAHPSGLLHDGPNGVVEYPGAVDGARHDAWPRDVGLLHDVHGHGSVWRISCRRHRASHRRALHRCDRWAGLHRRSFGLRHVSAKDPRRGA